MQGAGYRARAAWLGCALLSAVLPAGATDFSTTQQGRDAYEQIAWPQVAPERYQEVDNGQSLVRRTWIISPTLDASSAGLGPTYNRPSCLSCHPRNGRGKPPDSAAEPMRSILVRLSIPGVDAHGGPLPEPHYGEQLNELGAPGVPGEGEAFLDWREHSVELADGTRVHLRQPTLGFRKLAFGPLHAQAMHSLRVAPPLFGLGLLEAVDAEQLHAIAEEQRLAGQGIRGMPNQVWDVALQAQVTGRFGWKANQPSVRQQVAAALLGDMGITSPLFPEPNCPPVQQACRDWQHDQHPELSDASLDDMTLYHYLLAVPQPRNTDDPQVRHGEQLFAQVGCASCHRPRLTTGQLAAFPALSGQQIAPYTDLLLHDMGEGLADQRPDYLASGRQWRTPPLWGIGLLPKVNGYRFLLHDGRARSLLEAILWHGGEAQAAREAVRQLQAQDRQALLAFLESL